MKLEIEIPEPKFKKDDVVKMGELILHIYSVRAEGRWVHADGHNHLDWEGTYKYFTTVQAGKGPVNNPIRPGTILSIPETPLDSDFCLADSVKIDWSAPIIEPDSMENIMERWNSWDKVCPKN